MAIVLAKAKLCQLTANTHPSSSDKLDTSHESCGGLEKERNKSTKHKWRSQAPVRGSFVEIVSMIKPFSLQLDSLWRLYGLRK